MESVERNKIMVLDEDEKQLAAMIGIPEEDMVKMKQAAYDSGEIDVDDNGIVIQGPNSIDPDAFDVEEKDTDDDFECDGDCEHCSRNHSNDEDQDGVSVSELERVAHKHEDVLVAMFVAQIEAAYKIAQEKAMEAPEEERITLLICMKNAIMNTLGATSRSSHEFAIKLMGLE